MKNLLLASLVLFCGITQSKAILISDFGSGNFTIDGGSTSFTTTNQTSSTTNAIGLDTNVLAGIFTTVFDSSGYTNFFLDAKVTGINPGTSFNVDFYSADFLQTRTYTAFLSGFGSGVNTSIELTFTTETATFNDFGGFQFTGGGTGDALNITFNSVTATAVPEPATWALLAAGLATVVVLRRRRQA